MIAGMAQELKFDEKRVAQLITGRSGKITYQAPEIIEGKPFDGKQADCFALGVALFVMLTGLPPFHKASTEGGHIYLLILSSSIHTADERFQCIAAGGLRKMLAHWQRPISEAAENLISGLLCVDPQNRLTIDGVLRHQWLQRHHDSRAESSSAVSNEAAQTNLDNNSGNADMDVDSADARDLQLSASALLARATTLLPVGNA